MKQCFLTKCLWKLGLFFFQQRKWGKYSFSMKYNLFVKNGNIMVHNIQKIKRSKIFKWIKFFEMFELVQKKKNKTKGINHSIQNLIKNFIHCQKNSYSKFLGGFKVLHLWASTSLWWVLSTNGDKFYNFRLTKFQLI